MPLKCKIGSKWEGKYGNLEVLSYESKHKVLVRFIETGHVKFTQSANVMNGKVKDPYYKNIFGVGCVGMSNTSNPDGSIKKSYHSWRGILRRCYDEKSFIKNPTYRGVTVCEDWLCFENYEKWYDKYAREGFHVDKDFTVIGCKIYSPLTCEFIPAKINSIIGKKDITNKKLPTGVSYHTRDKIYNSKCWDGDKLVHLGDYYCPEQAREVYLDYKTNLVREVAEYYYQVGDISEVIRDNLYNFDFSD